MKRKLSLILAFVLIVSTVVTEAEAADATSFNDFGDINPQYVEAVTYVTEKGILSGYNDNTFRPQYILNRGAAAKIISIIELGANTASALVADGAPYPDVPENHVFAGYIAYCAYNKRINGYSDGMFRPSNMLTGYAFAKMLLKATNSSLTPSSYTGSTWKADVYVDAIKCGIFSTDMPIDPNDILSREEASWLIFNAIKNGNEDNSSVAETESEYEGETNKTEDVVSERNIEEYLNNNFGSCETPMGTFTYEITVEKNNYDTYDFDYDIKVAHKYTESPWYDIKYSHVISDEEKEETLRLLRDFQKSIYSIASSTLPNAKIHGGFYDGFYRYPTIKVGYETTKALSWQNYENDRSEYGWNLSGYEHSHITSFHWDSTYDDYIFD